MSTCTPLCIALPHADWVKGRVKACEHQMEPSQDTPVMCYRIAYDNGDEVCSSQTQQTGLLG